MSVTLRELQVYRTKVGLFTHRWGEKSGLFGTGRMIEPGSMCYLDQITPDGVAVFHLFGDECKGLYVGMPAYLADDHLEEVLNEGGEPQMVEEKP